MAVRNMGATGPSAVMQGTYTSRRHVLGRWGNIMIQPTEYKMRGFNTSTGQFEYWQTLNPNSGPPSGAVLTNKSIAAILVNTFPSGE